MSDTTELAKTGVDLVEKYADRIGDVLAQYSGPAGELALGFGRVGAINEILRWVCVTALSGLISYLATKALIKGLKRDNGFPPNPNNMFAVFGGVTGVVLLFVSLVLFPSAYALVGIFKPEIYLAAKALNL